MLFLPLIPFLAAISEITQDQVDSWTRREAVAINQLAKCVDEEMKAKIFSKDTAKDMWDCLESYHLAI